jgi:mono/diheme cytochrome c family protein
VARSPAAALVTPAQPLANVPAVLRPAVLIAVLLVAGGLAGCGGSGVAAPGEADLANGKKLFVSDCGNCHVLDDAGTSGTVGPNLDDAAAGSRIAGLKQSSFEALVRQQIDEADPPMPRHLVKGDDARDVAAYVASVAGVKLAQENNPGSTPQ